MVCVYSRDVLQLLTVMFVKSRKLNGEVPLWLVLLFNRMVYRGKYPQIAMLYDVEIWAAL